MRTGLTTLLDLTGETPGTLISRRAVHVSFLKEKRKDMSELFQQREHWDSCGHYMVKLGCFILALEDLDVHTAILTLHLWGRNINTVRTGE